MNDESRCDEEKSDVGLKGITDEIQTRSSNNNACLLNCGDVDGLWVDGVICEGELELWTRMDCLCSWRDRDLVAGLMMMLLEEKDSVLKAGIIEDYCVPTSAAGATAVKL